MYRSTSTALLTLPRNTGDDVPTLLFQRWKPVERIGGVVATGSEKKMDPHLGGAVERAAANGCGSRVPGARAKRSSAFGAKSPRMWWDSSDWWTRLIVALLVRGHVIVEGLPGSPKRSP